MSNPLIPERTAAVAEAPIHSEPTGAGLRVPRHFTRPGVNPLDEVTWDRGAR